MIQSNGSAVGTSMEVTDCLVKLHCTARWYTRNEMCKVHFKQACKILIQF